MHSHSTLNILGYDVFNSTLDKVEFVDKTLINTFSPNSYGIALNDAAFKTALKNSDILVLDGIGIALGSILIYGKNIKKIAGQDCFDYLVDQMNQKGGRCFFMGSSIPTLQKISKKMAEEYPNVTVGYFSPPFKSEFSEEDNSDIISAINEFQPDVLFIGLTAPKQEKWGYEHKKEIKAKVIWTNGNVFDWYAGNSKRPSNVWVKLRLEWLIRIFIRPEIFKRNTGKQLLFLRDLALHITHLKRIK